MTRTVRDWIGVLAVILILTPRSAAAQHDPSSVHISVGALGAAGIPGPLAAIRVSAIGSRVGVDVDWGTLASGPGDDRFVAAQLRVLTRPRTDTGVRMAWFIGANHRDTFVRTEVRWPGGVVTVQQTRTSGIAGQIGIGADWLGRRARMGVDLAGGGGESAGPRVFVKLFVTWGARVRLFRQPLTS